MSAEIVPFPFSGQRKWLAGIKMTFDMRRGKQKRIYIDSVLSYHVARMKQLGVAQELIDAEVAFIERMFFGTPRVAGDKTATA
jgi:hypothetical protein